MSDLDLNLLVVTEHLNELGDLQQRAADKITGANRAVVDVASAVHQTHGPVSWATGQAMDHAERARHIAGATTCRVSSELQTKLVAAAINYNDVDYRAGRSVGEAWNL